MINDQRYSIDKPPLAGKNIKTKKAFSKEVATTGSIRSYFQLAKMIVTKVREIEAQKLNEFSVGTIENEIPLANQRTCEPT